MIFPDIIYATDKIGSNGIHCLDYKNEDSDLMYIRADLVKLQKTSSNSDYTKCLESLKKEIYNNHPIQVYSCEEVLDMVRKHFA